jgi:hypothetical protein
MTDQVFEALFEQYLAVIAQMRETFTSHEFILCLARQNQPLYIEALFRYRDKTHRGVPAPFMRVHSILARHLHAYPELIEMVRPDASSTDIFGRPSKCAEWRRLSGEENQTEGHHELVCQRYQRIFQRVDDIVARIKQFQVEPDFSQAVTERINRTPDLGLVDDAILKRFIKLIAYSNNARADVVGRIVRSGIFDRIFRHYDVQEVADLEPTYVIQEYWPQIKGIRFQSKVGRMINCAKRLLDIQSEHGSFMRYLTKQNIPTRIHTMTDLDSFWNGFDAAIADLRAIRMPYFQNLTSLCHLLLDLGYDCAKPDSVIMKAAVDLQIVSPPRKKGSFTDREHREVVRLIQIYAMCRGIRVPVVDLYFLIHGGQTNAARFVQSTYYL